MHRTDHSEIPRLDETGKHGTSIGQRPNGQVHVLSGDLAHERSVLRASIARYSLRCIDRRREVAEGVGEVPELRSIASAHDRAAFAVAEHDDQLRTRELRRELQASDDVGASEVPSDAQTEDVTDSLIEHQLGRHSGVSSFSLNLEM